MKRIKEVVDKFKELWAVPLYRGLMRLGFWFLFFLVIFGGLKINGIIHHSNDVKEDQTAKKQISNIDSYLYNYQIITDMNTINISGTYYKGIDAFNLNNIRYYIKDNKYYLVENKSEVNVDLPLIEYQYNNIYNLIKDKQYESKTEYKDGSIEKKYIITSNDYNFYYKTDYPYTGNINMIVKEKDNNMINVMIDYSAYYIEFNNYQVIINYSNINNIDSLDIEV